MIFRAFLLCVLAPLLASAGGPPTDVELLRQSLASFSRAKVMRLSVEKKTESILLEKTETSAGEIHLKKDRFRWETSEPVKSLILFDGKNLWTMQENPEALGGGKQVTKSVMTKTSKDQILFRLIAGQVRIVEDFLVTRLKTNEGEAVFELKPKKEDPSVKDFILTIETGKPRLKSVEFKDEIGNVTTLIFGRPENVKKPAKDLFQFRVPKGIEVITL